MKNNCAVWGTIDELASYVKEEHYIQIGKGVYVGGE